MKDLRESLMEKLTNLLKLLRSSYSSVKYVSLASAAAPELKWLFDCLPGVESDRQIRVTPNSDLQIQNNQLRIEGRATLIGVECPHVVAIFEESANSLAFKLTAQAPAGWRFGQSFPELGGTYFDALNP